MATTGAPLNLPYLEDNESAPEIPWRVAMDAINNGFSEFDGDDGGGGAVFSRAQATVTSSGLDPLDVDAAKSIDLGKGGLIYLIETNLPAWVTIYTNEEARTNDLSRDVSADPKSGTGVLAEVVTGSGLLRIPMSPPATYWNDEMPISTALPVKIVSYYDINAEIELTVHYLEIES